MTDEEEDRLMPYTTRESRRWFRSNAILVRRLLADVERNNTGGDFVVVHRAECAGQNYPETKRSVQNRKDVLSKPESIQPDVIVRNHSTQAKRFILHDEVPIVANYHYEDADKQDIIIATTGKNASALLNTGGGSVFWGIKLNGTVRGVRLDDPEALRGEMVSKLLTIQPLIGKNYEIIFHEVSNGSKKLPNKYVVELKMPKLEWQIPYAADDGRDVWVFEGLVLRRLGIAELTELIVQRSTRV